MDQVGVWESRINILVHSHANGPCIGTATELRQEA